jgi:hypothetical protein
MVGLIIGVLVVGLALILLKVVPVLLGIVLIVGGLVAVLAIGDRLDRLRQRGHHDPAGSFDAGRGAVATPSTFAMPSVSASSRYDDVTGDPPTPGPRN